MQLVSVVLIDIYKSQTGLSRPGKNIWKVFLPSKGKVRKFLDGQGILERTLKVREKSENLKINGYGSQSSDSFILFKT